jgi:hypothetical protein
MLANHAIAYIPPFSANTALRQGTPYGYGELPNTPTFGWTLSTHDWHKTREVQEFK